MPLSKLRARSAGVMVLSRVSPASLLGGVSVGALRPVVRPATWTVQNLEVEHSEMIGGEHVEVVLTVRIFGIDREWREWYSSSSSFSIGVRDSKVLEHSFLSV
ncbi:uncharacterized protein DS421_17g601000 [Arachis hypogaea]|nr:uncharacterized protein DS421_17g601000 [Arachis hypogaea]